MTQRDLHPPGPLRRHSDKSTDDVGRRRDDHADVGISVDSAVDVAKDAAALLPFLPMLPFQILLNNVLDDTTQMTIPTDCVDEEHLARPSRGARIPVRERVFRL